MIKKFRALKSSFIIGIMLISVFASLSAVSSESNTAKAAVIPKFVSFDSIVELEILNPDSLDEPIHPFGGLRNIQIKVRYQNTVPSIFRINPGKALMFGLFKFIFLAPIHLELEDVPDWISATLTPPDMLIDAFGEGTELERTVTLQIAVNKESTALFPHTLYVKATGGSPDPHIKAPAEFTLPIALTPGYVPLIDTDPGQPIKKTNPGEPVSWEIKLTNNGNGEALVNARVVNPPKGWVISVDPQTIVPSLAEAETNEKVLTITALPPKNFGYYNEQVQISLELVPEFSSPGTGSATNLTKGEPVYLYLGVENRGFSAAGIEVVLIIALLVLVLLVLIYFIFKKKMK